VYAPGAKSPERSREVDELFTMYGSVFPFESVIVTS
jgi:hypothetical protein